MNTSHKILVVDDEEFNLDILTDFLSDAGYAVISARDGEEGLAALKQHPDVDVIVLDRMMPNMDGMAMLRHLKDGHDFAEIPVIMQTAAAGSQQIQEGLKAGVYYYLAKPYDESLLLSVVSAALRNSEIQLSMRAELQKQKRVIGLLERGHFRFRTMEEAHNLSYFIASAFSNPHQVVYGLNELMVNAVEHGNLGITYDEKSNLILGGEWESEIQRRLALQENAHKFATLDFTSEHDEITIRIEDMGAGFDWKGYLDFSPERAMDPNGRGIAISKSRSFSHLEYQDAGNIVICRAARYR